MTGSVWCHVGVWFVFAVCGAATGCGRNATTSTPPTPDVPAVVLADERACLRGDFPACRRAALGSIQIGGGDDARALRLADRACGGGYMLGCRTLGWLHEEGRGTQRNYGRARELYTRACDGGEMGACKSLAMLYDVGRGGPPERARAATLYERACDGGEIDACNNLANLYLGGDGVPRDLARAARLYTRVCETNHNPRACANARQAADAGADLAPGADR
jgi:TPR repeat protein